MNQSEKINNLFQIINDTFKDDKTLQWTEYAELINDISYNSAKWLLISYLCGYSAEELKLKMQGQDISEESYKFAFFDITFQRSNFDKLQVWSKKVNDLTKKVNELTSKNLETIKCLEESQKRENTNDKTYKKLEETYQNQLQETTKQLDELKKKNGELTKQVYELKKINNVNDNTVSESDTNHSTINVYRNDKDTEKHAKDEGKKKKAKESKEKKRKKIQYDQFCNEIVKSGNYDDEMIQGLSTLLYMGYSYDDMKQVISPEMDLDTIRALCDYKRSISAESEADNESKSLISKIILKIKNKN
jgi:hypothetical protein